MKLDILSTENKKLGSKDIPVQFSETIRSDLIRRAVLVKQANDRQRYGANPDAGLRYSSFVSKRRHNYRGTYGIGQSRTPRKVMSVRGTRFNWVGAFAPQTVGGRRAHPPKADKILSLKINIKERRKAIRSALAATLDSSIVSKRGHVVPSNYPFVVDSSFESFNKTKDVVLTLKTLGFADDLARAAVRKVRAGKGKMRGRKYKSKTSILLVTAGDCDLILAGNGIAGVDVVKVTNLNAELLAPGTTPGRMTLFTESAIDKLAKEALFTDNPKITPVVKPRKSSSTKKTSVKKETAKSNVEENKVKVDVSDSNSQPVDKKVVA